MSTTRDLHNRAMDLADSAAAARRAGNEQEANRLFEEAFEYERRAARRVASKLDAEPTRSVLHRSAASLALNCNRFRDAEQLISIALAGNPPLAIAEELRELLQDVHLKHHLKAPSSIRRAPGSILLQIADFFYSPKTVESVFRPIVNDWRIEYFEALQDGRTMKAHWISARYSYHFIIRMGMNTFMSFVRRFTSTDK